MNNNLHDLRTTVSVKFKDDVQSVWWIVKVVINISRHWTFVKSFNDDGTRSSVTDQRGTYSLATSNRPYISNYLDQPISTVRLLCKYDIETAPSLVGVCSSVTRGHSLRLQKNRTKCDLCKFCFANRIVNIRNSSPSYAVSAETVNCFKIRLDRFWLNQDIIYYFRSEIHGTRSRNEITVKSSLE